MHAISYDRINLHRITGSPKENPKTELHKLNDP